LLTGAKVITRGEQEEIDSLGKREKKREEKKRRKENRHLVHRWRQKKKERGPSISHYLYLKGREREERRKGNPFHYS